ncbi:methyl-CpG-binding domain protein 1-like [Petaurus breviceps papuanus]|uniref:methyl-CpG-binding domain protein 1-like n=1 Tax=Petaurus breviceps papuanus TaxID=3040969 RepID=UPI0036DE0E09
MSGRSVRYGPSPSGELVRSEVEQTRILGPNRGRSFYFRRGVRQRPPTRASSEKSQARPRKAVPSRKAGLPPPAPQGPLATRCDHYGTGTAGGSSGQQPPGSLCESCRARRNAFSREQRLFRRVGCGDCAACRVTADCGVCMACAGLLSPRLRGRCVQRCCLRVVPECASSGRCAGCHTMQGSGACRICERKGDPGLQTTWKCLQQHSLRKQPKKSPRGLAAGELPGGWHPGFVPAPLAPGRRRQSRQCGACVACRRREDCGQCDFCQDKPKFGGCNLKRQKCRWRQCLRIARKQLLPEAKWDSPDAEGPALPRGQELRRKEARSRSLQDQRLINEALSRELEMGLPVLTESLDPGLTPPPGTDLVILQERGETMPVPPAPSCIPLEEYKCPGLGVISSPHLVKQKVKSYGVQAPGAASPPPPRANRAQLQHSLKQKESSRKGEDKEEAAKANTPVIMEIYSLSGATPVAAGPCGGLDSVLQEFLAELNELLLPAHWEVLPPRGPDLCIIQRSLLSTVATAVIHIQPGLYFQVVVQDVPVPPSHELYLAHPLRITTVDEVVELICDLEGYQLCPGIWQQGPRSPDCDVLVYEGRCQACCLEPYASGSSRS